MQETASHWDAWFVANTQSNITFRQERFVAEEIQPMSEYNISCCKHGILAPHSRNVPAGTFSNDYRCATDQMSRWDIWITEHLSTKPTYSREGLVFLLERL